LRIPAHAQTTQIDVYVQFDPQTGASEIYFMDILSGLSAVATVYRGTDFTLLGQYVLFEDPFTKAIMRANVDGSVERHPFIQRESDDIRSIQWVVSPDRQSVAWVTVNNAGQSSVFVAAADGGDLRQLPIESPEAGLMIEPVALSNGRTVFLYDSEHPITPLFISPFPVYTHINRYNITQELFEPLGGEPNCPCGASLAEEGRIFVRLEALQGEGPFDLRVWDLPSGGDFSIAAPTLTHRRAGNLILNPVGTLAAYSTAMEPSVEGETVNEYALVVVDVVMQRQTIAVPPGPDLYTPIAFIDDDSALMLASPNGTYKLTLADNSLQQVATATYLGSFAE
jgi:hypothetical protein